VAAAMLLFALTGQVPPILLVALAVCLYLTVWDLWNEDLQFLYKAWWFTFVLLTHVFGYLVFRVWIARRRGAAERP
jgi:membrane protein YdbS with pleckstrin-like domain